MTSGPGLSFAGYTVHRKRRSVVRLDATVASAGVTVVAGANGSGKSTLLAGLAGLLCSTGEASLDGTSVSQREVSRDTGYLPQHPGGLDHVRLRDAIGYSAQVGGTRATTSEVGGTAEVVGVGHLLDRRIRTLSGGERQLSYLACVMVNRPRLLLLDEPTVALDASHRVRFRETIAGAAASGTTVLMASHLPQDVATTADSVLVLDGGGCVFAGPVAGLIAGHHAQERTDAVERALRELEGP
jgi:ABC-2 type transport system ATP-binding protein